MTKGGRRRLSVPAHVQATIGGFDADGLGECRHCRVCSSVCLTHVVHVSDAGCPLITRAYRGMEVSIYVSRACHQLAAG